MKSNNWKKAPHSFHVRFKPKDPVYTLAFSYQKEPSTRFAVGSLLEKNNRVSVIETNEKQTLNIRTEIAVEGTAVALRFVPDTSTTGTDILAVATEKVQLFRLSRDQKHEELLTLPGTNAYTSLDWSESQRALVGAGSLDRRTTVWDTDKQTVQNQLLLHEGEVLAFSFAPPSFAVGGPVFATAGADAFVRLVDARGPERTSEVFRDPRGRPLTGLSWNKPGGYLLAVSVLNSESAFLVDLRAPGTPVAVLKGHKGKIVDVAWSPFYASVLASVDDQKETHVWDVRTAKTVGSEIEPSLIYSSEENLLSVSWSLTQSEWLALVAESGVELLKI